MPYVTVKEDTEEKLHFCREPSARAWAIVIGLCALGIGASYYSVDETVWKMVYLSGAFFIGLTCMEDWEECILDKSAGQVTLKKQSLIQRLFQATQGQRMVVGQLEEVVGVQVQEEEIKRGTVGYSVVLQFCQGYSLGVTETITIGDKTEHEQVALKIRKFLNLADNEVLSPLSENGNGDDNSSTSDESFEKIDTADLVNEEVETPDEVRDISEEVPDVNTDMEGQEKTVPEAEVKA